MILQQQLRYRDQTIPYEIRRSLRAKRLRITIYPAGRVVVSAPRRVSLYEIDRLIAQKTDWIGKTVAKLISSPPSLLRTGDRATYLANKKAALRLAHERLEHFNRLYGFVYHRISIRNQSSRWGSCSRKGNLSFNYRLVFLDPEARDYLIVHELCHLKEFNHSKRFWELVAKTISEWKRLRKGLRGLR